MLCSKATSAIAAERPVVGPTGEAMTAGVILIFGGAFLGMVLGWIATSCVLLLMGMGHSHNDMFTVFAGAILGAPVGAVMLPLAAWWRGKRRLRRPRDASGS